MTPEQADKFTELLKDKETCILDKESNISKLIINNIRTEQCEKDNTKYVLKFDMNVEVGSVELADVLVNTFIK